jgi:hypothetical protein
MDIAEGFHLLKDGARRAGVRSRPPAPVPICTGAEPLRRGYDDEAMKPLGPRLDPPRPWWFKWMLLAIFAASAAMVPTLVWPLRTLRVF